MNHWWWTIFQLTLMIGQYKRLCPVSQRNDNDQILVQTRQESWAELSCEGWWRWRLVGFDYFVLSTTTYLKWKIIKLVHLDWLIINFLLVHCCTHDILTTKLNICQTQFGGLMHKSEVLLSTFDMNKVFFQTQQKLQVVMLNTCWVPWVRVSHVFTRYKYLYRQRITVCWDCLQLYTILGYTGCVYPDHDH